MGAPSINIAFIEKAESVIQRGERGVLGMLLVDTVDAPQTFTVYTAADIPSTLSANNQLQLNFALRGYVTGPKKILVYVTPAAVNEGDVLNYADGLAYFATTKINYFCAPTCYTDGMTSEIVTWVRSQRDTYHMTYKAVLPNAAADHEGIINVTTGFTVGSTEYTAEQVCSRIAGIICGTPLTMSCTYAPITEATDCTRMIPADLDDAVDDGELVLMWDGEKVKICRGVTSFTTKVANKGDSFKKIKLVEAMDMIRQDITMTAQDTYIGKYANTYDNKCLLIAAINAYFATLQRDSVLDSGRCDINVEANRQYFLEHGGIVIVDGEEVPLEDATDEQIRQGNTGSYVFLKAVISLLDAIEDIDLQIYIG